jgi:hypothetical protein
MTPADIALPPIHRPAFFAGEILHASELDDVVEVERSLRWLHNRVLHGWGIGLGLEVTGPRGATSVGVAPGYALDAAGRDLVLEAFVTLPVPPVASGPDGGPASYLLVLAYTEDDAAIVDVREGACDTAGAVRRHDDPTVAWRLPQAVREGLDVVLAAASVAGCALAEPLQTEGVRRGLGAIPSPHAAVGNVLPAWRAWPSSAAPAGLAATIDTRDAGFGDVPVHQVTVVGERAVSATESPTGAPFVLDGHAHVDRPGILSFDVVVPLPAGTLPATTGGIVNVNPADVVGDAGLPAFVRTTLAWTVQWIGVEAV